MKAVLALLVLTSCVAVSNATFKLLQSKLKPAPAISRYQAVKYPIVVPEPLPATLAHPVSTYVSTYSISPPPYAYATRYSPPAFPAPLAVSYETPLVQYDAEPVYLEPLPAYSTHVIDVCSS